MTTIKLKNGSGAPTAGDLAQGEPALDLTNKRLYTEDSGGTVIEVGTNPGTDVTFADNRKAIFGAGSDLQIYHTGSHSYVDDTGTGNLYLNSNGSGTIITGAAETQAQFFTNGAVNLFYDNAQKLATTSTGIDVTGTVTADGLTVDGDVLLNGDRDLHLVASNPNAGTSFQYGEITLGDSATGQYANHAKIIANGNYANQSNLEFHTSNNNSSPLRMKIHEVGDISFYEDTGTTAKLFWDASAETLVVTGSDAGTAGIFVESSTSGVGARLDTIDATTSNSATLTNSLLLDSDNHAVIRMDSNNNGSGDFYITESSSDTARLRVANNGDVSLFEDTGTTAKLYWDASAESLGIGTSSPSVALEVNGTIKASGNGKLQIADDTEGSTFEFNVGGGGALEIYDGSTERMRIDSSGQVGIGTSSPSTLLHVKSTGSATATIEAGGGGDAILDIKAAEVSGGESIIRFSDSVSGVGFITYAQNDGGSDFMRFGTASTERMRIDSSGAFLLHPNNATRGLKITSTTTGTAGDTTTYDTIAAGFGRHIFKTDGSERMRIDSSGNLLVGKSSSSFTTAGVELAQGGTAGKVQIQRSSSPLALVNLTDDGNILNFYKGTSAVGSIGVDSGDNLYIAGSAASHGGLYFGTNTAAPLSAGTLTDDVMDLGTATYRFDDVYATNGTINTSDRNEKQDIEALSDAEQRVAVACKGLLRKFRWKSSVADKGDDARIHFGIIAQDLQAAFEAEGLDAGRYAMFISTTWTDEETGEERTRMGVRYSELLAFIIAAI